jgi:hypothetical protein
MAAEAMARHGHADQVHRWLDVYMRRLEEFPRGSGPIGSGWQDALGDPRRIADWTAYFRREVTGQPWRQALETWWPRLLPGVVAAATHGVIRVGHAVRALVQDGEDADHLTELAHGLAYWAARWQPLPGVPAAEPPRVIVPTTAGEPVEAGLAAAAALTAIYAPAAPASYTELPDPPGGPQAAEDTFARAVEHGDEHVIKFADTAADVYARTGDHDALAAAIRAAELIGR